jgi:hypothetical protein
VTGSHDRTGSVLTLPLRHLGRTLAALTALVLVVGGTSLAAAATGGAGAGRFAASFDARAVGDPSIESCPALGREGQKIEARYEGTFTIPAEERRLAARFSLEILFDRSTGVGAAEGTWQLAEPPDPDADPPSEADPPTEASVVGRGELIAVVTADPPGETEPPDPDLELQGLVIGLAEPPDPDKPAQRLLGSFTGSITDGTLNFTGGVGDPSVGDPSGPATSPAVLLPAIKC